MPKRGGVLLATALCVVACSGPSSGPAASTAATPTAGPSAASTSSSTLDESTPGDGLDGTGERYAGVARPGAPANGLGDPLIPELGAPGVDTSRYDVELDYDPTSHRLIGHVTITLTLTEARSTVSFDAGPKIEVDKVSLDGTAADYSHADGELVVNSSTMLAARSEHEVVVDWVVTPKPSAGPDGLPLGWFTTSDGSFTLDEPDGLRSWMPANDHPSDKAVWHFLLTVPDGFEAAANGTLVARTVVGSKVRFEWSAPEPMATYLVLVMTGHFDIVTSPGPDGVQIQDVVLSADRPELRAVLDRTDDMLTFFRPYFGPYPFATYGLAITAAVPGLAMETQTRSLFHHTDLLSGDERNVELLLSHELAHQWFGDAVSPARWSDTWLNEGFATYGEWMWLDHAGFTSIEESAAAALREPRRFAPDAPSRVQMFDQTVYSAGGVVLHALRRTLGDDAFFGLLRDWARDERGDSATTPDFVRFASEHTGRDLSGFFAEWLSTTSPPAAFPEPS